MKTLRLLIIALLIPCLFHAQNSLTGLWTGTLSNDSTTVRRHQPFEIALTQYKEKVYGYSRSSFIVNDTLFYIVKRVKGTINGDVCEVKDDEILSSNFADRIDKGVKVVMTFRRNRQDSSWHLSGDWKTTAKRKTGFYNISGKIELREETSLDNSKLFGHLDELRLSDDVPFYAETKKPAIAEPIAAKQSNPDRKELKKQEELAKAAKKEAETREKQNTTETVAQKKQPAETSVPNEKKERNTAKNTKEKTRPAEVTIAKQNDPSPVKEEVVKTKTQETKPTVNAAPVIAEKSEQKVAAKPEVKPPATAAAFVATRKTVPPQVVEFRSDSLQLALYDNGEVDGDTVSVLLNGEVIMAKQGLRTIAIKKTIYVQPGQDEINLILYAENLGKYPPNTGLLVVHDGDNTYQVRFSADLTQNASVVFKRKR